MSESFENCRNLVVFYGENQYFFFLAPAHFKPLRRLCSNRVRQRKKMRRQRKVLKIGTKSLIFKYYAIKRGELWVMV